MYAFFFTICMKHARDSPGEAGSAAGINTGIHPEIQDSSYLPRRNFFFVFPQAKKLDQADNAGALKPGVGPSATARFGPPLPDGMNLVYSQNIKNRRFGGKKHA